jgi:hypothetical protein
VPLVAAAEYAAEDDGADEDETAEHGSEDDRRPVDDVRNEEPGADFMNQYRPEVTDISLKQSITSLKIGRYRIVSHIVR